MCGIGGIFSFNKIETDRLVAASKSIAHRGTDDEGFILFNTSKKTEENYLGDDSPSSRYKHILSENIKFNGAFLHRRLSIIDLSENGHQPMSYDDDNLVITYNGEIYNFLELKASLKEDGFSFKSDTDTEVLLACYKKWGVQFTEKLKGMWAFSIYDKRSNTLFLSRDRFGIKPLYYYNDQNTFSFCSEVKGLIKLSKLNPVLNKNVAIEYIGFGKEFNPDVTMFEGISELPPGHNAVYQIDINKLHISSYYTLNIDHQQSQHNVIEQYESLLSSSIKDHLISDVPVGINLSGGLDSSAIAAFASPAIFPENIHSFTARYNDKAIDESNYAELVVNHLKNISSHFIEPSTKELINDFDKLIYMQDFPIGSTSIFAQWSVMNLAKQNNIKVVLSGQGADEVLGGYFNFAGIYLIELLSRFNLGTFYKEYKLLKQNMHPNVLKELLRAYYYFLPETIQKQVRKSERIGPNIINEDYTNSFKKMHIPQQGGKSFQETSVQNIKYGLRRLLRFEDRNSMAHSIESRVPFLDHELVEFTLALKSSDKIKNGWTKHVLRKVIDNKLPADIVWRKGKKGFLTPQSSWKKELSTYFSDYINNTTIPDIINKKAFLELTNNIQNSTEQTTEYWKILSFIKWCEIYNIKIS